MPESLSEIFTLASLINIPVYAFSIWLPVYLTYRYHLAAERNKEKAYNHNTLVLLSQELDVIQYINDRIRKSSLEIVAACKETNRLVFDEFPHRIDTKTLESLIANLVLYREQNPKLLRYLIELKSNIQVTNESLELNTLSSFVKINQNNDVASSVESYFDGVFGYLQANVELIKRSRAEVD